MVTKKDRGRGLVCVFCGEGFGYVGATPDEAVLRAAVGHEAVCSKNPYKARIAELEGLIAEKESSWFEVHGRAISNERQCQEVLLDLARSKSRQKKLELVVARDAAKVDMYELRIKGLIVEMAALRREMTT